MFTASRLKFNFSIRAYNPAKNYYKTLNISESADQKEIKKAFRDLAKKYHPDSAKGKE
jgi:DnaJ-class molecular chaperone